MIFCGLYPPLRRFPLPHLGFRCLYRHRGSYCHTCQRKDKQSGCMHLGTVYVATPTQQQPGRALHIVDVVLHALKCLQTKRNMVIQQMAYAIKSLTHLARLTLRCMGDHPASSLADRHSPNPSLSSAGAKGRGGPAIRWTAPVSLTFAKESAAILGEAAMS